jgi:hypothetical protein
MKYENKAWVMLIGIPDILIKVTVICTETSKKTPLDNS